MEDREFYKRIDDLRDRAQRRGVLTRSAFLTPAEQFALQRYYTGDDLVLTGGQPDCERQVAFFLPEYMEPESFDPTEHIRALRFEAHFGMPGHRDYLGAAMGLGIARASLGDIRLFDEVAYVFCLSAVEPLLLEELKKVGRVSVTASACTLSDVPRPVVHVKTITFTVKSLRLDAVTGALFGLSRTAAAELIRLGAASLNYAVCDRTDAPVREGDVISLRGHGKGRLRSIGGRSKKDRLFAEAEVYL